MDMAKNGRNKSIVKVKNGEVLSMVGEKGALMWEVRKR